MFNNIAEAVQAALTGSNEGFNYLYDRTYKNKYYVALKYMKNEDAAADVLQDSYMKAFQNLSMLQDHSKFEGWLGMIVANTAKNYLKKNNPVLFSEMDQETGDGDMIEYQDLLIEERRDFNPEEHYSKQEASELVNELLDSLSPEQKICMIMFYLEGQTVEEISTALECNKNTVLSRLNYGRKKIKAKGDELEKKGYKLYSVSPVALLAILLSFEKKNTIAGSATGAIVNSSAQKTGAGRKSFLSTTAGKITAAVAGLAIVGGITAAVVLGLNNKDKKDKTDKAGTEYQVNNGSTEVITETTEVTEGTETSGADNTSDTSDNTENSAATSSTDDTAASTESTEAPTEVAEKDTSEILRAYLDEKLVPKYGVYDPSQMYLSESVAAEAPTVYSFEYDEKSGELIRMETDVYDYEGFMKNYSYDYSGIYYAMIDDYNNDDQPELLIIRGTGVHKIESVGYEANEYIAELYHVEDDKAVLTAETPLYFNENGMDGKESYRIDNVYTMTRDGQKCLMIAYWEPHSDVSQNDYAAILSLKDLSYVSYLHGTMVQEANNVIYSSYVEKNFTDGSTKEYRADYREVNGKWEADLGFGSMNEEYLTERGYMNDTTEMIFTMCMLTDISREYIFEKNSDNDETTENESDGQAMTEEELLADLADEKIYYRGDNRYETRGLYVDKDGNCVFSHSDHEPYTFETTGEAKAKISKLKQLDDHTYSFKISKVKDTYTAHTDQEEIEDPNIAGGSYQYYYTYEELADTVKGEYIIYLPGTPVSELPQDVFVGDSPVQTICKYYDEATGKTNNYIIYKKGEKFAYYAH